MLRLGCRAVKGRVPPPPPAAAVRPPAAAVQFMLLARSTTGALVQRRGRQCAGALAIEVQQRTAVAACLGGGDGEACTFLKVGKARTNAMGGVDCRHSTKEEGQPARQQLPAGMAACLRCLSSSLGIASRVIRSFTVLPPTITPRPMGDPLGALAAEEEPLRIHQRQQGPRLQQQAESAAAAAAAAATSAAASAAAALRSAAAAIRTATALPLQQQQQAGANVASSSTAVPASRSSSAAGGASEPASHAGAPPPLSPSERTAQFRLELGAEPAVDMQRLRALAFGGVPDDARGLRAAVWRLLLGLLPPERGQWERVLRRRRAEYAQFCEVRRVGVLLG